eukprot:4227367-Prymnesium_polylepis.1
MSGSAFTRGDFIGLVRGLLSAASERGVTRSGSDSAPPMRGSVGTKRLDFPGWDDAFTAMRTRTGDICECLRRLASRASTEWLRRGVGGGSPLARRKLVSLIEGKIGVCDGRSGCIAGRAWCMGPPAEGPNAPTAGVARVVLCLAKGVPTHRFAK